MRPGAELAVGETGPQDPTLLPYADWRCTSSSTTADL